MAYGRRGRDRDGRPGGRAGGVIIGGPNRDTATGGGRPPAGAGSRGLGRVGLGRDPPPPPGTELAHFATVSDLHIGERRFGMLGGIRDVQPAPTEP